MRHHVLAVLFSLILVLPARAADVLSFQAQEIDPHVGNVCYALTVADVNGDGKLDVVAVTENAVVWFANPGWEKQTIIQGATARDNVCIQPHDIDGDGRVDFALGAGWRPSDTQGGGTVQWLKRDGGGAWQVVPIGTEPTVHRMRFGRVLGDGKTQLVVAPLQGRGTRGPNWGDGQGARVMVFSIPTDPAKSPWQMEVADDSLHTVHNLQLIDFDGDGQDDILLATWEGVYLLKRDSQGHWSKTRLGTGNQDAKPFKGSSEIKLGSLGGGRKYIATIEPWHGYQVVVYTPPKSGGELWDRQVIDEPLQWGHAVWCANLDDDPDQELIIGQRDKNKEGVTPRGPGVRIYDPKPGTSPLEFTRYVVDDGGVAVEDLLAADLDGDGRNDVIAGGRATHNVKIYWNRASK
jgi:Aldos-2-ulose dehydratase, beta-propeller domain/FG-GAP-like repeat